MIKPETAVPVVGANRCTISSDADKIDMTGAREVYKLLDELDGHINGQDASGRALLCQAKERIRMLIIRIDRSNAEWVPIPRADL